MTDPRITGLLATRGRAKRNNDPNVVRACDFELAALGYREVVEEPVEVALETTVVAAPPENTARPRGRPPKRKR